MNKDFAFAHLVHPAFRAVLQLSGNSDNKVLTLDRHLPNGHQVVCDVLWNLPDNASNADAAKVINQMMTTIERDMLTHIAWEGEPMDTAERQAHAILGLLDRAESLQRAQYAYADQMQDYAFENKRLRKEVTHWSRWAWTLFAAASAAVIGLGLQLFG